MSQYRMTEKQIIQRAQQYESSLKRKTVSVNRLSRVAKEVEDTMDALKEIKEVDGKVHVKVGAGIFVEVEAKKIKTCKRGFAENGFIEDSIPSTIKWLEDKKKALEKNIKLEQQDITKLDSGLAEMISLIRQIEVEKQKTISRK